MIDLHIAKGLKCCPLCRGWLFARGKFGGYFCTTCQPIESDTVRCHVVAEFKR